MELELAIAVTCEPTGCQMRHLDGSETSVRYGTAVQDRIMIRPGDLVVVDSAMQPPVIVWRWWHGRVERLEGGTAVISRKAGAPRPEDPERTEAAVPVPDWLAGSFTVGDTVYFTHGNAGGIVDLASNGSPLHPERVRSDGFAEILATYARMQNAP